MRSMMMATGHGMKWRHEAMIFRFSKVGFLVSRQNFSKIFFAQNLKLVPLSNPKKYRIKTLTTAPRRRPVCCTKNGHIWFLLGLITLIFQLFFFSSRNEKFFGNLKNLKYFPLTTKFRCSWSSTRVQYCLCSVASPYSRPAQ